LSESELYKDLGLLTKDKNRWKESIPYVSSLLTHESVKIQAKVLWLLGEMGLEYPQEVEDKIPAITSFCDSTEPLLRESGAAFFASQSYTGVAEIDGKILGLYILHPNNVGRCGHICNASYAVSSDARGQHIGEQLVLDCLKKGKELGFRVLQFNAVVESANDTIRM